jgi:tetratricopeptide (TPR) repeat protein
MSTARFPTIAFLLTALFTLGCANDPEPSLPTSALYERAMQHIARTQLDSAQLLFREIVGRDSTEYTALLGLAEINMRKRNIEKAIPFLQRAIRVDTTRVDAPFQLAQAYRMLRRDSDARRLLKLIVERFPTFTPACMAYADVLMTDAPPSPEGALEQYEAILAIEPQMLKARAGAGASRLRLGHFQQAEQDFLQLLRETPNDPHITSLLATARHWQKDYLGAIDAYKTAIDVLPVASPQRRIRQWNLRLAYLEAHGTYPGDLLPTYQITLAHTVEKASVRFEDVAKTYGVDKIDRGRGVSWVDVNGDGRLDLFTVGIQAPHGLFIQTDRGFSPTKQRSNLDDIPGGWAAIAADFDGDGDSDLYVTRDAWEGSERNSLYQNDGYGRFVDIAGSTGTVDEDDSFTAAWGDVNGDGYLDLYVADGITGSGAANKLFVHDGKSGFSDEARLRGVNDSGKSLGVAFGDYDLDGDLDLYVANVANSNRLYRNDGDTFTDIASSSGLSNPINGSYVPFFFDSDSDGDLDIFVSSMAYFEDFVESATSDNISYRSRAHLYRNDGNDRFSERAAAAGLARAFGSMGAGYSDVDNDGQLDIYLANGGPIMSRFEPNALFMGAGDHYVEVAAAAGVDNLGKGHGVAFADYDNDGDSDIYVGLGGHYPGDQWPNSLYRNEGTANRWLSVALQGIPPNVSAIGAQATLFSGNHVHHAEVQSGGGFGSTNSYPIEFGLGTRTQVDSLIVRWPSGQRDVYTSIDIDQYLHLAETK